VSSSSVLGSFSRPRLKYLKSEKHCHQHTLCGTFPAHWPNTRRIAPRCATFKDHERKDLDQALGVPDRTSVLALCQSLRTSCIANGFDAHCWVSCHHTGYAANGRTYDCTIVFATSLLAPMPMAYRYRCDPRAFEPIAFLLLSSFVLIKRTWHNNRLPQCAPLHDPPHGRTAASSVRCTPPKRTSDLWPTGCGNPVRIASNRLG
jgi:hypothetical protein